MKKHNFNSGPSILPATVIAQAATALHDFDGIGLSILEIGHRTDWFVAVIEEAKLLVKQLMQLNDDYEVERKHALKAVIVDVMPEQRFLDFMKSKGKEGGQHKFPRVLKGKMLEDWQHFLQGELVS